MNILGIKTFIIQKIKFLVHIHEIFTERVGNSSCATPNSFRVIKSTKPNNIAKVSNTIWKIHLIKNAGARMMSEVGESKLWRDKRLYSCQ